LGKPDVGGKIPYKTQHQLQNVKMIFPTHGDAFIALLNDGREM